MTIRFSPTTLGFYPYGINYPNLPEDCIDVPESDHHAAMQARAIGGTVSFADGKVVIGPPPPPSFDDIKSAKLSEIALAFTSAMATIRAGYADDEVQSWSEQKAEAVEYSADNSAPTPLLSAMAKARGITLDDLVERVLENARNWSIVSGSLIGKRQACEDAVTIAKDAAAIAAIKW